MEKSDLIQRFASAFGKSMIAELTALAQHQTLPLAQLHGLCYDDGNPQLAFRAAWVLEYVATNDAQRLAPLVPQFISQLPLQENRSCQRHFTKVLMLLTHDKAHPLYHEAMAQIDKDELVDVVFGWLIDPDTPVAVQVNCLDILVQLAGHADWIAEELEKQTHFMLREGSPAMQSRGKRVLEKLKRIRTAR